MNKERSDVFMAPVKFDPELVNIKAIDFPRIYRAERFEKYLLPKNKQRTFWEV